MGREVVIVSAVNIEEARRALDVLERARTEAVKHRDLIRNSKDPSDPMLDTIIAEINDRIARILPKVTAMVLGEILEYANEGVRIANEAGVAVGPQIRLNNGVKP
jgi:hypothetical protein